MGKDSGQKILALTGFGSRDGVRLLVSSIYPIALRACPATVPVKDFEDMDDLCAKRIVFRPARQFRMYRETVVVVTFPLLFGPTGD